MYRVQKNITLNKDQRKFIEENFGKMDTTKIAQMLGLGYNKVRKNLKLLGKVKPQQAKVIPISEYFDVDAFGKLYNY